MKNKKSIIYTRNWHNADITHVISWEQKGSDLKTSNYGLDIRVSQVKTGDTGVSKDKSLRGEKSGMMLTHRVRKRSSKINI